MSPRSIILSALLALLPLASQAGMTPEEVKIFDDARLKAGKGNAEAQFNLGLCYAKGEGVPRDGAEAVKWYRKAAEQGHTAAQNNVAHAYYFGLGVPKDYVEAVRWNRKAAEQGDARAQLNLGLCYAKGEGVPKDDAEAVKWFRKAAEQGHTRAQYKLGVCYANGDGVLKDEVEAYAWFNLSADTIQAALEGQTLLEKELPATAIEAGKNRSKELQALIEKNKAAAGSK